MSAAFTADHISDAKRVARGEQYLAARALLRSRSTERTAPRILMLAGGDPAEELGVIRELWKGAWRAHVVAVDRIEGNVAKAIDAGADDVFVGELAATGTVRVVTDYGRGPEVTRERLMIPDGILAGGRYDLLHLDFCGLASDEMRRLVHLYHASALVSGGVNIVAFSYGHDVVEAYLAEARGGRLSGRVGAGTAALIERGLPEAICGRIAFLSKRSMAVESVVLYRGHQVPMCSVLFQKRNPEKVRVAGGRSFSEQYEAKEWPHNQDADTSRISFAKIGDGDLSAALEHVDAAALYAMPQERLASMRRVAAARKAVATRSARLSQEAT